MRERRKARLQEHLKTFLQRQAVANPDMRARLAMVECDEGLFTKVFDHTTHLMKRHKKELGSFMDEDSDTDPSATFWEKVMAFFAAHWQDILAFIMSLFLHANTNSLELAPAPPPSQHATSEQTDEKEAEPEAEESPEG